MSYYRHHPRAHTHARTHARTHTHTCTCAHGDVKKGDIKISFAVSILFSFKLIKK